MSYNRQCDRMKDIMHTLGSPRGEVDSATLQLSARLAGMELPQEFLFNSPYAKKYTSEWDESVNSPRSVKWRPFMSAVEYSKIQPGSQEQFLARHEEKLAMARAKEAEKNAIEALVAAQAAEKAEKERVIAASIQQVPDDVLRKAHRLVKGRLESQYGELKKAFQKLDVDRSGDITRAEAVTAIKGLELGLPDNAIHRMIDLADYDCDGTVTFAEFARIISADDIIDMKDSLSASATTRTAGAVNARGVLNKKDAHEEMVVPGISVKELRQAVDLIRDKLLDKYHRLDTAFKTIDADRSGHLSRAEMRFCVMTLNLEGNVRPPVIEAIVDLADVDGDNKINHREFCDILSAPDPTKLPQLQKIKDKYTAKMSRKN